MLRQIAICAVLAYVASDGAYANSRATGGSSCGVLCVRGAFSLLALPPPDTASLFHPKYLDSALGSSADQLVSALKDNGLYGMYLQNMSVDTLKSINKPAILHVTDPNAIRGYSHWVLFSGSAEERVRLIDFPSDEVLVLPSDLLQMWDGSAIVIDREPISRLAITSQWAGFELLPLLAGCVLAVLLSVLAVKGDRKHRQTFRLILGVLIATSTLTVFRHAIAKDGFMRNARSLRRTVQMFREHRFAELDSSEELKQFVKQNNPLIIDARVPEDFRHGHIDGAINISVFSNRSDLRDIVENHDLDTPVVVYCQSAGCTFSDRIGSRLFSEGFSEIYVYRSGWADWSSQK